MCATWIYEMWAKDDSGGNLSMGAFNVFSVLVFWLLEHKIANSDVMGKDKYFNKSAKH